MTKLQDIHQLNTFFFSDLQNFDVLAHEGNVRLSARVFDLDVLFSCGDSFWSGSFASADLSHFAVTLHIRMTYFKLVWKIARKILGTLI